MRVSFWPTTIPSRSLSYARCYAFVIVNLFFIYFPCCISPIRLRWTTRKVYPQEVSPVGVIPRSCKINPAYWPWPMSLQQGGVFQGMFMCSHTLYNVNSVQTEKRFSKVQVPSRRGPWERGWVRAGLQAVIGFMVAFKIFVLLLLNFVQLL